MHKFVTSANNSMPGVQNNASGELSSSVGQTRVLQASYIFLDFQWEETETGKYMDTLASFL